MSRYVNIHMLISHTASALNCDETGSPKTAHIGGYERLAVSSQSIKKPVRDSDMFCERYGKPALRTASVQAMADYVTQNIVPNLDDEGEYGEEIVKLAVVAGMTNKTTTAWMPSEIEEVLKAIYRVMKKHGKTVKELKDLNLETKSFSPKEKQKEEDTSKENSEEETGEKTVKKAKKEPKPTGFKKELIEEVQKAVSHIVAAGYSSMDVAFFGRMCASGALKDVMGAVAFSHAIGTHELVMDTDYFTATDDLKARGAGHINDKDFASGTLYLYFSINVEQLARNLGISRREAMKKAAALPEIVARTFPSGKQNSFASQPIASYIMVECLENRLSLHEAFEEPVQPADNGGFTKPSVVDLEKHWDKMHRKMGHAREGHTAVLTIYEDESMLSHDYKGVNGRPIHVIDSIENIEPWICSMADEESDEPVR